MSNLKTVPRSGSKCGVAIAPELPRVDRVLLVLTGRCNMRCAYCYQTAPSALRMTRDILHVGIEHVLKEAAPQIEITFTGGEPLLEFEHIREAVTHVRRLLDFHNRARYWLVTNGLLLTPEIANFLQEHKFKVQLSFDGIPAAQDCRGAHTFEILDQLLDSLRARQLNLFQNGLTVAMTVIPPTVRHMADSVEYFIAKGVPEIAIAPATTHYPGWETGDISELDSQVARISEISRRHLEETGKVPVKMFRKYLKEDHSRDSRARLCRGLSGRVLAIDADGQAYVCPFFAESCQKFPAGSRMEDLKALRLGDIRNPALPRRRASALEAARRLAPCGWQSRCYSSYGACAHCDYRAACTICPVSIWSKPDDPDPFRVPDFICAFNRLILKYRERFLPMPGILDTLLSGTT